MLWMGRRKHFTYFDWSAVCRIHTSAVKSIWCWLAIIFRLFKFKIYHSTVKKIMFNRLHWNTFNFKPSAFGLQRYIFQHIFFYFTVIQSGYRKSMHISLISRINVSTVFIVMWTVGWAYHDAYINLFVWFCLSIEFLFSFDVALVLNIKTLNNPIVVIFSQDFCARIVVVDVVVAAASASAVWHTEWNHMDLMCFNTLKPVNNWCVAHLFYEG